MTRITSEAELRKILPQPRETTKAKLLDHLDEQAIAFLAAAPFLLLATSGADGAIEVSPKGDEPGFVQVEDARTVLIPDRAGNNLAFGLRNILQNPRIGVIVLRPATGETLRFSGSAEIRADADLLQRLAVHGKPAVLALRVRIERAYFHCARSVLRAGLWQPDTWPAAQKVSFGRIIAPRTGGDAATADRIDEFVANGYRTGL